MNTTAENLIKGVEANDMQAVRAALDGGADVNARDQNVAEVDSATPLHLASSVEMVALLLDRGADVNAWNGVGDQALLCAAHDGNIEKLQLLLDRGTDIDMRNEVDRTALQVASLHGNAEIVALLLDRGADPNTVDFEGGSPLHEAASVEVAALLLDRGANSKAKNSWGETPSDSLERYRQDVANFLRADEQARSLAATLDAARPPETVPEPPARVRLSNDPMDRPREDLGTPDPKPARSRSIRL